MLSMLSMTIDTVDGESKRGWDAWTRRGVRGSPVLLRVGWSDKGGRGFLMMRVQETGGVTF